MHFHVSVPPPQCCRIAASRSFIASTSGGGRGPGVLVEEPGGPRPRFVDDLATAPRPATRRVVHRVGILSRCAVLPRPRRPRSPSRWRQRGRGASAAQSHRSARPGLSRLSQATRVESSRRRFRMAKAPAIKSKATANATRRRAIAGRVFAGRDSTAAPVLRLRDAHRPLVGSAVPSGVAQPAEQRTVNPRVESSSLSPGARRACSSVVRAGDS